SAYGSLPEDGPGPKEPNGSSVPARVSPFTGLDEPLPSGSGPQDGPLPSWVRDGDDAAVPPSAASPWPAAQADEIADIPVGRPSTKPSSTPTNEGGISAIAVVPP